MRKRIELKDPVAMFNIGMKYSYGGLGLPMDQAKCIDLLREAADLGGLDAQYQLGSFHRTGGMGLEQNEVEALKYFRQAAEGGHLASRNNLGSGEKENNGEHVAAMRHWRLAASGGSMLSIANLLSSFRDGFLHHDDLAETLQAFYRSRAEMRSEDRDRYIEHLKMIGEYHDYFDL